MGGKANQPQWREDIATVCALRAIVEEFRTVAETVAGGHGRIEQQRLETSDVLVGYSDWPGLAQVFHLERQVIRKKAGGVREAVVCGVLSQILLRRSSRGSCPCLWRRLDGQGVEQFGHSEAFVSLLNHHLPFLDHVHELDADERGLRRVKRFEP